MKKAFIVMLFLLQAGGFVFASIGVLREAFATTAITTGAFSREAVDEKAFDVSGLSWLQEYRGSRSIRAKTHDFIGKKNQYVGERSSPIL